MATIRKHGHNWQAIIRLKDGYPPSYKCFPTKQEAKDWASREEARRRQEIYFPEQVAKKHSLTIAIDKYIELILPSKPKSARDILRHLNWWKEKLGNHALARLTPEVVAHHRKELMEGATSKGTQRSYATVNRYMAALSVVLTYAVKECGWISANPLLRISKLKESRGRERVLSKAECDRLLASCAKSRNALLLPIVILAITTGMRQGEILNLTWGDVDLDQGIISLKETKNGRPRSVPIVSAALKHIRRLSLNRKSHIPFVFPSKKRFGRITIRRAWEEAVTRCSIENLHFHDLRHTFCTYAAKAGASNLQLRAAMGHQTSQMTDRYTHLDVSHTRHLSEFVETSLLTTSDAHGID